MNAHTDARRRRRRFNVGRVRMLDNPPKEEEVEEEDEM
jgi:hypothetical protein